MTKNKHIFFCLALGFITIRIQSQNIPRIGKIDQLELCNWNLEWFGKTTPGFGPADDIKQQQLVLQAIKKAETDVWAFCEISEPKAFDSLMQKLPLYQAVVSGYSPEQKTAVIFKKDMFRLGGTRLLGTAQKDSFSTLRFPLEVALVPHYDIGIDTLFLIVIHLKANTGTDSARMVAYNSRKKSSQWLKMYLEKKNRFCIVLGDWNDDLDASIYNGLPSPFLNLQSSGFSYRFISKKFSDSGIGTTTQYKDAIDHQLISDKLYQKYILDSTMVWRLDRYIVNYGTECSDHYPVYSYFNTYKSTLNSNQFDLKVTLCPNPATDGFNISENANGCSIFIMDYLGVPISEIKNYSGEFISAYGLNDGFYLIKILSNDNHISFFKLIIQH